MTIESLIISFIVSFVVSTIIIYVVAKVFGETEGIGTAALASLVGTVIYVGAYYMLGNGLLAALLGGIVWLIALGSLYKIGWIKSLLIAIIVWVFASVASLFLPTLVGPL